MKEQEIQKQYYELKEQLLTALSTMQYSEEIPILHQKIEHLRSICPHVSKEFTKNNRCPYCGKYFGE